MAVESHLGLGPLTMGVMAVLSTPYSRLLLAVLLALTLSLALAMVRRRPFGQAYGAILAVAAIALLALDCATGTSPWLAMLPLAIIASNVPFALARRSSTTASPPNDALMASAMGISEVFLFGVHCTWLAHLAGNRYQRFQRIMRTLALPALVANLAFVVAGLLGAGLLEGTRLVSIEHWLRSSPEVRVVDHGDFNALTLDESRHCLFAPEGTSDHLRCYALDDSLRTYRSSDTTTGRSQGFGYDPVAGELYTYDRDANALLYFDAATLHRTRTVTGFDLSPGDSWIVYEPRTNAIIVASEADDVSGTPIIVVDRTTGAVRARRNDPGNSFLVVDPDRPVVYMSFFATQVDRVPQTRGVMAYDVSGDSLVGHGRRDERVDRAVLWQARHELLVTAPTEGRIWRIDTRTFQVTGTIRAALGVRPTAVDERRHLLLFGSTVDGCVTVVDLLTGRRTARFYLGPWLRTIALREADGIAYVSTIDALYELRYATPAGR